MAARKSTANWFIYTLKCPRTLRVRYVGFGSTNPKTRLQLHIWESVRHNKTLKQQWILSLVSIGLNPLMEIVEEGAGEGWVTAEKKWIKFYRDNGAPLTNSTEGGESVVFTALLAGKYARAAITHCPQGHEYTPENTYFSGNCRSCVECNRARARERGRRIWAAKPKRPDACRGGGHDYTPQNTRIYQGTRICRECSRLRQKRARAKKRGVH